MNKKFNVKPRTLTNLFFAAFGVGLFFWVLYLSNYAYFCNWHFEDSEARFLVLGDPQMEGDARVLRQGVYGEIDLMYNDAYFRHIISTIMKYLSPTHVFVLGDLFSSQYITEKEFENRLRRYEYVFESVNVPLYNISGNHDLGYAGEVSSHRVQRFERAFGKVNDEVVIADHVVGIVNSLNIDTSTEKHLQEDTWKHLNNLAEKSQAQNMPLIMMTHIPLHKESYEDEHFQNTWSSGKKTELCTDRSYTTVDNFGHIEVQNMLLPESTQNILDSVKPAFVLAGHDHDGCIYRHNDHTVEYTIRSMMGEYGGYAGMFEIRRNTEPHASTPFSYHFTSCPFVGTTTTTVTFVVAIVYVLIASSVNLYYVMLPSRSEEKEKKRPATKYEYEYEAQYIEKLNDYVMARGA